MNDQTKEAVELLLSNRLFLYSLMHKLFGREPDEELLNILTDEHTGEAFGLLSEEEKDIMDRTAVFLGEIREEKQNPAFLEEAKDEYTRLFIGPMSLVAPPWESVYGQKDAMLFQESTLEVRNTYRQYGLIPATLHGSAGPARSRRLLCRQERRPDRGSHRLFRLPEEASPGLGAEVHGADEGSEDQYPVPADVPRAGRIPSKGRRNGEGSIAGNGLMLKTI